MNEDALRALFKILTGRRDNNFEPENYVLEVQDGEFVALLLGRGDPVNYPVNYLSEDDFVSLGVMAIHHAKSPNALR